MNKILVVDDESDILEEVAEILSDEGYEVSCAISVDDGLDIMRKQQDICVVLTDLQMPVKTGEDFINEARKEFKHDIRFIIMSGHASPTLTSYELEICQFDFLRKPLDIDLFLKTVKSAFDSLLNNSSKGKTNVQ